MGLGQRGPPQKESRVSDIRFVEILPLVAASLIVFFTKQQKNTHEKG